MEDLSDVSKTVELDLNEEVNAMPVWLDVDPGHDDAFALILAAYAPSLNLLGVSTVYGNQSLEKTTKNALRVLFACGKSSIPVVAGASHPLCIPVRYCPEVHGESGLDGTDILPVDIPLLAVKKKAITCMAEAIMSSPEPVCIVATACLTNIALLLSVYPEVKSNISQISFLGGAVGVMGNIGPVTEFNVMSDPEAAHIVFTSGVPLAMHGLQVTHSILVTQNIFERIERELPTRFGKMVSELLIFFQSTYESLFDMKDPPLHDPLAVAWLLDRSRFTTKHVNVEIERHSPICRGQTVCDLFGVTNRKPNASVSMAVDVDWFWDCLMAALRDADAHSPLNEKPSSK